MAAGLKVMGCFCVGANTLWEQPHPEQSYGIPSGIHPPLNREYLDYLRACVPEAPQKTSIDGFMLHWAFTPPRLLLKEKKLRRAYPTRFRHGERVVSCTLQRISHRVFGDPVALMGNVAGGFVASREAG